MENEEVIEVARRVFEEGNQVLIVGVIPSNMGKWWERQTRDPRIQILDMREKRRWRIPGHARLVLATDYRDCAELRNEFLTLNKGTYAFWPQRSFGTGEIHAILESSYSPQKKSKVKQQLVSEERFAIVLPVETEKGEQMSSQDAPTTVIEKLEPVAQLAELFAGFESSVTTTIEGVIIENRDLHEKVKSLNFDLELSGEYIKELEANQIEFQKEREAFRMKIEETEQRALELENGQKEHQAVVAKLAEAEGKLAALRVFKEAFINI